jgi:hypothetical protein
LNLKAGLRNQPGFFIVCGFYGLGGLAIRTVFIFGIAVFAPRARRFFATAQKSHSPAGRDPQSIRNSKAPDIKHE